MGNLDKVKHLLSDKKITARNELADRERSFF